MKKPSTVSHSVKPSPSQSVVPARPRGRPPKNGHPQKPSTDAAEAADTVKRKSDGPNLEHSLPVSAPDKFPLR